MDPILSPSSSAVSTAVIDQLARTKGWTRFFSVLLWIGAGFMILGGLALMGMGLFSGTMGDEISQSMGNGFALLPLGIIYLVMAAVYVYPALKLGNFSSRITELMNQPTETSLVAALNEQRAFSHDLHGLPIG
ncbi:MAG: hypothetical protein AAF357_06920 [Verrucomicrobiota bacterium]